VFRELVDGTGVLLNLDTAGYHGLNGLGVLIWTLLGAGMSLGHLVNEVRNRVHNAPPELEDDVAEFLEGLQQRQLVVVSHPAAEEREAANRT
jgi:hypothetical protein